jgi:hypothetical protein
MALIRCTQKLLAELRIKPDPADPPDETGWHANLLRIEGYHCVLFTHDQTLFSFLVCRPGRIECEHLPAQFGQGLFKALLRSGCTQGQVEAMLNTTHELRFAKTNNRRVLGSMNDMARLLERSIAVSGGLGGAEARELHQLLNETPFKAIGYETPVRRLRDL